MEMDELSDWVLIQRCRAGRDDDAWGVLVSRYERLVFYVPYRMYGLPEMDAADVTQTVFTILTKSLDSFHEKSNVKSWLVTVTKRHTWRHIERAKRDVGFENDDDNDLLENLSSGRSEVGEWETVNWLNAGLVRLSERCRSLLTALYLDEVSESYEEIAKRFGMKVGSIGPTRARCLAKLREFLSED